MAIESYSKHEGISINEMEVNSMEMERREKYQTYLSDNYDKDNLAEVLSKQIGEKFDNEKPDTLTDKELYCIAMHIQAYVKKQQAEFILDETQPGRENEYFNIGLCKLKDVLESQKVPEGHYMHEPIKSVCISVGREFFRAQYKIDQDALPCMFCKYESKCHPHPSRANEYVINWWAKFRKLSEITGVIISPGIGCHR